MNMDIKILNKDELKKYNLNHLMLKKRHRISTQDDLRTNPDRCDRTPSPSADQGLSGPASSQLKHTRHVFGAMPPLALFKELYINISCWFGYWLYL